jgi:hypothetical protein
MITKKKVVITKEMVASLSSDTISRKAYAEIIALIDLKVDEIWRFILKTSKRKLDWYAFRNDVSYGRGNGSSGGEFDPIVDKDFIEFIGEYQQEEEEFDPFAEGFPTEFLWSENYPELVRKGLAEGKKKKEQVRQREAKKEADLKKRMELARASIKKKLTSEELKYIKSPRFVRSL